MNEDRLKMRRNKYEFVEWGDQVNECHGMERC